MSALARREKAFALLRERIVDGGAKDLECLSVHTISSLLLEVPVPVAVPRVRRAAQAYLTRSFAAVLGQKKFSDHLLWGAQCPLEKCDRVTPNGMIVPKGDSALEYNILVLEFVRLVDTLGFGDLIRSWHVPLNVRVKWGEPTPGNLQRAHPTEFPHSDSWAGESSESVTVHLPLFGDVNRNYVTMFQPPEEFEESWLGPRGTYKEGAEEVAAKYTPVQYRPWIGGLVLMDFATLHASHRAPGARARISIDTTFVLKKEEEKETIHPWRVGERASHAALLRLGEKCFMRFPSASVEHVDVLPFQHPANLTMKDL